MIDQGNINIYEIVNYLNRTVMKKGSLGGLFGIDTPYGDNEYYGREKDKDDRLCFISIINRIMEDLNSPFRIIIKRVSIAVVDSDLCSFRFIVKKIT